MDKAGNGFQSESISIHSREKFVGPALLQTHNGMQVIKITQRKNMKLNSVGFEPTT